MKISTSCLYALLLILFLALPSFSGLTDDTLDDSGKPTEESQVTSESNEQDAQVEEITIDLETGDTVSVTDEPEKDIPSEQNTGVGTSMAQNTIENEVYADPEYTDGE